MRWIVFCLFILALCVSVPAESVGSSLLVSCGVPGASVSIDSLKAAVTDGKGEAFIENVPPGSHSIGIAKEGYVPYTEMVVLKDKLTAFVTASLRPLDTEPPRIVLISPGPSRGIVPEVEEETVEIIGLAVDQSPVVSVTVNGAAAALSAPGEEERKGISGAQVVKFSAQVKLTEGKNSVTVEALDAVGNKGSLPVTIVRQKKSLASAVGMDCHALLIGIDEYRNWPLLKNPVNDINVLAEELKTNFGFSTEVLLNPSKREIQTAIRNYYAKNFTENSELLIVMAGHGHFDEDSKTGYFVGADGLAPKDDPNFDSYIAYPNLQQIVANIPCSHIMLVLDACYGGTFNIQIAMRGGEETYRNITREEFVLRKLKYKTRLLLTSGGKEYVPDGRVGQHSPFIRKFLEGLRGFGGQDGILTIEELMVNYMNYVEPEPHLLEFQYGNEPGSSFLFIVK